jgi:hypothetical protein
MSTYPPVPLTLSPEAAHRVHFLALESAGRASLTYASHLLAARTAAYRDRVAALPCGEQDAEADRTEWKRADAVTAWEIANAIGQSIREVYTDTWNVERMLCAAEQCRDLCDLIQLSDDEALHGAYTRAISECADKLDGMRSALRI